jgi:hypothetical protein
VRQGVGVVGGVVTMTRATRPVGENSPGHLLVAKCVTVWAVDGFDVTATVEEHGRWVVTRSARGWTCTCPKGHSCNHVVAVKLISPGYAALHGSDGVTA